MKKTVKKTPVRKTALAKTKKPAVKLRSVKTTAHKSSKAKKSLSQKITSIKYFKFSVVVVLLLVIGVAVSGMNSSASASTAKSTCVISLTPAEVLSNQQAAFNITITNNSKITYTSNNTTETEYVTQKGKDTLPTTNLITPDLFFNTSLAPGQSYPYSESAIGIPSEYNEIVVKIVFTVTGGSSFTCKNTIIKDISSLSNLGSDAGSYKLGDSVNTNTETIYACLAKPSKTQWQVNAFEISSISIPTTDNNLQTDSGTIYNLSAAPTSTIVYGAQPINTTVLGSDTSDAWDYSTGTELSTSVNVMPNTGSYVAYQSTPYAPIAGFPNAPYVYPSSVGKKSTVLQLGRLKSC
jgi:hypothetical protein